jgi:hypothetical protein
MLLGSRYNINRVAFADAKRMPAAFHGVSDIATHVASIATDEVITSAEGLTNYVGKHGGQYRTVLPLSVQMGHVPFVRQIHPVNGSENRIHSAQLFYAHCTNKPI